MKQKKRGVQSNVASDCYLSENSHSKTFQMQKKIKVGSEE
jgi:hypothetical protein